MKLIFMGTPDLAAACLSGLLDGGYTVTAAVTQADRPRGRGYALTPPPVKELAMARGIPVWQPTDLRAPEFLAQIREMAPDAIVVVAYGRILPPALLDCPRLGCINLHASLLPRYRGAAPIQRAIMNGETETGLTTMHMAEGLDTGDMILSERLAIRPEDNFGTLHDRMAVCGGPLLCRTLAMLATGTAPRLVQDEAKASYAAKIRKEDCALDFRRSASELDCHIRGLSPAPLAFCHRPDGRMLKILRAEPTEGSGKPGEVLALSDRREGSITVACGTGALRIRELVPEGKGRMRAADYVRGRQIREKEVLY